MFASVTIAKPFALGLDIPFFLAQTGDAKPRFSGVGLGDIRLVPKIRFIDGFEGVGLALVTELRAPTHVSQFSGGARMISGWPKLVLDYRSSQSLHMGINVGALIEEQTQFRNVIAASEFTYGAALGYRFGGRKGVFELGGELDGAVGLVRARREETPLEGYPYFGSSTQARSRSRWALASAWSPGSASRSSARSSASSGRRRPTIATATGSPTTRTSALIRPRTSTATKITTAAPTPTKTTTATASRTTSTSARTRKRRSTGSRTRTAAPTADPPQVIREDGKFRVIQNIKFRSGSAEIDPQSDSILNQVALTLKANPDIKRMRIEGHTDETGGRDLNMRLSQERANAVRNYLINRGVKPDRLRAEGYGPDRPLVKGNGPEALAKNRRVEFIIE